MGVLTPHPPKDEPVPAATDYVFDAVLHYPNFLKLSFSPDKRFSGRLNAKKPNLPAPSTRVAPRV